MQNRALTNPIPQPVLLPLDQNRHKDNLANYIKPELDKYYEALQALTPEKFKQASLVRAAFEIEIEKRGEILMALEKKVSFLKDVYLWILRESARKFLAIENKLVPLSFVKQDYSLQKWENLLKEMMQTSYASYKKLHSCIRATIQEFAFEKKEQITMTYEIDNNGGIDVKGSKGEDHFVPRYPEFFEIDAQGCLVLSATDQYNARDLEEKLEKAKKSMTSFVEASIKKLENPRPQVTVTKTRGTMFSGNVNPMLAIIGTILETNKAEAEAVQKLTKRK